MTTFCCSRWYGHVLRMALDRVARMALELYPSVGNAELWLRQRGSNWIISKPSFSLHCSVISGPTGRSAASPSGPAGPASYGWSSDHWGVDLHFVIMHLFVYAVLVNKKFKIDFKNIFSVF